MRWKSLALPPYTRVGLLTISSGISLLYYLCRRKSIPIKKFSEFLADLNSPNAKIKSILISSKTLLIQTTRKSKYQIYQIPQMSLDQLIQIFQRKQIPFQMMNPSIWPKLWALLLGISPIVYLALVYRFLQQLNHSNSDQDRVGNATDTPQERITFDQVAGIDPVKVEMQELVDALTYPEKYRSIGARLPRGILLAGPSGTGKTLLARAVASEAQHHFVSCSASDFVEMLVGRGAKRVRELFKQAAAHAPCVIFIDEIDALAKARGGINSNDEREQTLNQLLTEMDGFERCKAQQVVVIAATNRPQILDPALVRPGRFDRTLFVDLPNEEGRREILNVHVKNVTLGADVDLDIIAKKTLDASGADLAALVNDAALLAVRAGELCVQQKHLEQATERAKKVKEQLQAPLTWLNIGKLS